MDIIYRNITKGRIAVRITNHEEFVYHLFHYITSYMDYQVISHHFLY